MEIQHLADCYGQLITSFDVGEPDFSQCLRVLGDAPKDLSSFALGAAWAEGATVTRGLPEDSSVWVGSTSGERCRVLAMDEPLAAHSIWSRLFEPFSFRYGLEAPTVDVGHKYLEVSTATSSITPDGYFLMPLTEDDHSLAVGGSTKLAEGVGAVNAFISHLHRAQPEVIPAQTLRVLQSIKALPDNWDGDGATRIAEETVSRATRLIRQAFQAAPNDLKPPSVAPAFGGMIVAEWSGPGGRELILDIPPAGESPGFLLVEPNGEGEEIETDAELTPPWTMRQLIARLIGE